jgi:hypothetical protein
MISLIKRRREAGNWVDIDVDFWEDLRLSKVDSIFVHKVFFRYRAFLLLENFH